MILLLLHVPQNTSNVDFTNIEENHETIVNNVAKNDPKIFISTDYMLNDTDTIKDVHSELNPITTNIVEKHSNSIPNDEANREFGIIVDGNNDVCEEGEFVPPTNGEQNVLHNKNIVSNDVASSSITNIVGHKGLDEDGFSKAGSASRQRGSSGGQPSWQHEFAGGQPGGVGSVGWVGTSTQPPSFAPKYSKSSPRALNAILYHSPTSQPPPPASSNKLR
ncbi:hypothetical protein MA16_Dca021550 [Dendrobium catenatum]|uniref:Uncharacterized protein n=1 Tax=Dendrobium catenatum TaxID=906689 RepID=A0A2I0VTX4_9ASPA|nr:hypothetical protein MA16_Dca021550 [Dendrobium catenatum]